jgi:hypothetical protein
MDDLLQSINPPTLSDTELQDVLAALRKEFLNI